MPLRCHPYYPVVYLLAQVVQQPHRLLGRCLVVESHLVLEHCRVLRYLTHPLLVLLQLSVVEVRLIPAGVVGVVFSVSVCHLGPNIKQLLDGIDVTAFVVPERLELLLQNLSLESDIGVQLLVVVVDCLQTPLKIIALRYTMVT